MFILGGSKEEIGNKRVDKAAVQIMNRKRRKYKLKPHIFSYKGGTAITRPVINDLNIS